MKAIGRNIVIEIQKEDTIKKTDGGLMLTNSQRVDVRYKQAKVLHCGNDVKGIKDGDVIYFDKTHAQRLEVDKDVYHVIKDTDVVIIL